jgi:hypothetical protein
MGRLKTNRVRTAGIEGVYRSTHACEHPGSSHALVDWEPFDAWVERGCPARLDLTDAERAVITEFLASRTG